MTPEQRAARFRSNQETAALIRITKTITEERARHPDSSMLQRLQLAAEDQLNAHIHAHPEHGLRAKDIFT